MGNRSSYGTHNDNIIEQLVGAGIVVLGMIQLVKLLQSDNFDGLEDDVEEPVGEKQL